MEAVDIDEGGVFVAHLHVTHQHIGHGGVEVAVGAVAEGGLEVELVPPLADAHIPLSCGGGGGGLVFDVHVHKFHKAGDNGTHAGGDEAYAVDAFARLVGARGSGGGELAHEQQRDGLVEHLQLVFAVDV